MQIIHAERTCLHAYEVAQVDVRRIGVSMSAVKQEIVRKQREISKFWFICIAVYEHTKAKTMERYRTFLQISRFRSKITEISQKCWNFREI